MGKHLTFILLLIISAAITVTAQELNIDVKVTTPISPTADPKLFETLENQSLNYLIIRNGQTMR